MPDKAKVFILLLSAMFLVLPCKAQNSGSPNHSLYGALVRGDTSKATLSLVFTGDEFADGEKVIPDVLHNHGVKASFFLTGKFYRNPAFSSLLHQLAREGHYLGAHSDQHLLYCDWSDRDSLLVNREEFEEDLKNNYRAMEPFLAGGEEAFYYLPPYEWYNDSISAWTRDLGLQLINYSHGTLSHADYTVPGTRQYRSSREIYDSILEYEAEAPQGLNGFILLSHVGSHPDRTDKFYYLLEELISELKRRGYAFQRIDELL